MANILVIIPGQTESDLCAKSIAGLMRWHEMARRRSGADE